MGQITAVVTDSLACLPPELAGQYGIKVVPLSFMLNGNVYRDWVDITPSQAYEVFLKDPESFRSSAPSPVDFLNAFREASQRADNILCVTLSAKLSTTYNAAKIAKEQMSEESRGKSIAIFDSGTTTAAEGLIALAAARAAFSNKDLAEVAKAAQETKEKVSFVAVLDTIRHVYRSGRIPKIASQIGSALNVKPVLTISTESGLVRFIGIVRTHQDGIDRMLRIMKDKVGNNPIRVAVMHAYALEEAKKLKEIVANSFNCTELWLTEFSPLMGYTTGTGTLGLAFHRENK